MAKVRDIPEELHTKVIEIKSWLFHGDVKEVAKRSSTPRQTVSSMMNLKATPSKRVLECAIEVMNENKARFEIKPKMKVA
jgi:hypothetical protein